MSHLSGRRASYGAVGARDNEQRTNTLYGLKNERKRPLGRDLGSKPLHNLSDAEKSRRKRAAMEFLNRETNNFSNTTLESVTEHNRPRKPASGDPINRKTYELLRERPIRHISERTRHNALRNDAVADTVAREARHSLIQDNEEGNRRKYEKSRDRKSHSLLGSLSEFGSKVLGSILYNENQTGVLKEESKPKYTRESQVRDAGLDSTIILQQAKLDKINREIEMKKLMAINDPVYENRLLQRRTEGLEDKLQSILKEVNTDSNERLLKELLSIKNEVIELKKKQESNNMRFESRFEDLKLEQQRNKRSFDRMISELDEKREDLDREKDKIIRMLKRRKTKSRRQREVSESSESDIDRSQPVKRVRINSMDLMDKVDRLKRDMSTLGN